MSTGPVSREQFEGLLAGICERMTLDARTGKVFSDSRAFEEAVRNALAAALVQFGANIDFDPHPFVFPDIVVGHFGVEVKFTASDTWRSVANSIFEGTRGASVEFIYVVFGKFGGEPAVDWDRYDRCVIHVRTSHVPRFEIRIGAEESLFDKIGVSYRDFTKLPIDGRMDHVRKYARGRLKKGERLWWIEDRAEDLRSLPAQARLYMTLDQAEKRKLRAEAALLCPEVVKPSRSKHKYDNVTLYLLTCHGVLCPQARDLFSAGSVAMRNDSRRGGNYILRALEDIQGEMRDAALRLDDALFVEYWEESVPPAERLTRWLQRADALAVGWKPSKHLFLGDRHR